MKATHRDPGRPPAAPIAAIAGGFELGFAVAWASEQPERARLFHFLVGSGTAKIALHGSQDRALVMVARASPVGYGEPRGQWLCSTRSDAFSPASSISNSALVRLANRSACLRTQA